MPVAPQANALLVVDDVRGPLGITSTAPADIDMMQELINSASDVIEAHCHRKLKQRAFTALRLPRQTVPRLRPPATPINVAQTVTLSFDEAALTVWRTEADGVRTERDVVISSDEAGAPSYFQRAAGWWSSDNEPILLSYTGGYDPIPGGLKRSAILTVQAFHRQEQNLEPYQSYPASATGGTVVMRTDTIPRTAMLLLEPYCFVGVA